MNTITTYLRLNATPFVRSMHDAAHAFNQFGFAARGLPTPPRRPYPKQHSGMTSRQYRAARRAYARAMRDHQKGLR